MYVPESRNTDSLAHYWILNRTQVSRDWQSDSLLTNKEYKCMSLSQGILSVCLTHYWLTENTSVLLWVKEYWHPDSLLTNRIQVCFPESRNTNSLIHYWLTENASVLPWVKEYWQSDSLLNIKQNTSVKGLTVWHTID